jgi:hypothetical protein
MRRVLYSSGPVTEAQRAAIARMRSATSSPEERGQALIELGLARTNLTEIELRSLRGKELRAVLVGVAEGIKRFISRAEAAKAERR